MDKIWYIQQLDLFKGLDKRTLHSIESLFFMKEYCKREVIFEPGDKNKVFIVKTGRVELYHLSSSGKKTIIEILAPGSIFGDLGTFVEQDLFVEATVDSYVCSMVKNKFFSLVSRYPNLAEKLMKNLFNRLLHIENRMSSLAADNALQRLVKLLLSLGRGTSDIAVISDKFTHEELAQMLGISRQTVTTLINMLARKGLITRDDKKLRFTPTQLEAFAS